jgi:hypothetical protein
MGDILAKHEMDTIGCAGCTLNREREEKSIGDLSHGFNGDPKNWEICDMC